MMNNFIQDCHTNNCSNFHILLKKNFKTFHIVPRSIHILLIYFSLRCKRYIRPLISDCLSNVLLDFNYHNMLRQVNLSNIKCDGMVKFYFTVLTSMLSIFQTKKFNRSGINLNVLKLYDIT